MPRAPATLLLAVVLAAGCGGGGGGGTATPPSLPERVRAQPTQDVWAVAADEACATLLDRFHDAMHPGDRSGVAVLEEAARLGHTDLTLFEAARPPAKARHGHKVLAAALAVQLIALEELAQAEDESNEARARIALDRARDARRRLRPYAEALGLDACAAGTRRR